MEMNAFPNVKSTAINKCGDYYTPLKHKMSFFFSFSSDDEQTIMNMCMPFKK